MSNPIHLTRDRIVELADKYMDRYAGAEVAVEFAERILALFPDTGKLEAENAELKTLITERNHEIARSLEIQASMLAEMDQMRTVIEALGVKLAEASARE